MSLSPIFCRRNRIWIFAAAACLFSAFARGERQYAVDAVIGTQEMRTRDTYIEKVIPLANGKVLILGDFDYVDDVRRGGRLVRLDSAGRLDQTFSLGGFAFVTSAAIAPGGEIWVVGTTDTVTFRVQKLTADGATVPGVSSIPTSTYSSLTAAPDGGFFVVDRANAQVTRFTSDAKPASGFSMISLGSSYITGVAVSSQGAIALLTLEYSGYYMVRVFSVAGVPEPNATAAVPVDFTPYSIEYDSSGRLLMGGVTTGQPRPMLIRLLQNGALDAGFGGVLPVIYGSIDSIHAMPDGRLVATGSLGNTRGAIEFSADGVYERIVTATSGSGQSAGSTGAFPLDSSRYIVSGSFQYIGGIQRNHLAEVFFGGGVSRDFTTAIEGMAQVNTVARSDSGEILFGGYLTRIGQTAVGNLGGMTPAGVVDANFPTIEWATNTIVPTRDGGALVLGAFSPLPGTTTSGLVKLRSDHSVDTTFLPATSLWGVDCALSLADGSTLLGGQFGQFNGNTVASLLTRVTPQGSIDPAFFSQSPASSWQTVSTMASHPQGGFLIAGTFTEFQGKPRPGIARVDNNGIVDPLFAPAIGLGVGTWPRNLTVLADGSFYLIGNPAALPQRWSAMIRFTANGTVDSNFAPPFDTVLCYSFGQDGSLYVAGMDLESNEPVTVKRVLANGQLDPNFVFTVDGSAAALVPAPDGSLYIGGRFTEISGQHREGLARIIPLPLSVTIDGSAVKEVPLRGSITLSARVISAAGPVSFEWYHNGDKVRGAEAANLELSRVSPKDAGAYTVAVKAAGEKAQSPVVTLSVIKGASN